MLRMACASSPSPPRESVISWRVRLVAAPSKLDVYALTDALRLAAVGQMGADAPE